MVQKKRRISAGRKYFFGLIAAVGVVSVLWGQSFVSLADSTGTVKADSANIREKADTNSDVIGSASSGTTVSIKDEVQDSSGTLWYQVYVNANTTGYIRADLVDKTGGDSGNSSSQSDGGQTASQGDSQSGSGASGALEEPDNVMDAQYAVITAEKIIVRTAPSTNEGVVDRLVKDDQVIVGGQSNGSDGKLWYYVTFTGENGTQKTGFIRYDLLSLGEMVPVPEEETPEPEVADPEPEPPVNNEYELTHEKTQDGTYVWYLYDYTEEGKSNHYLVSDLMRVTRNRSESEAEDAKTLVRQRVAIVVLSVLLVIVIAVAVVMALKLRDVYYEEYEDEDEEEEEETPPKRRNRADDGDETPVKRKSRADEEEETPRRRRSRAEDEEETPRRRRSRADEEEETPRRRRSRADEEEETPRRRGSRADEEEEAPRRRRNRTDEAEKRRRRMEDEEETEKRPAATAQKRKTKNFLLDDDEFEFEFLNMEDKDS